MRMPFGKHKGEDLEDIPTEYLEWCLSNLEFKPRDDKLQEEMDNQVRMRSGQGVVRRRREE